MEPSTKWLLGLAGIAVAGYVGYRWGQRAATVPLVGETPTPRLGGVPPVTTPPVDGGQGLLVPPPAGGSAGGGLLEPHPPPVAPPPPPAVADDAPLYQASPLPTISTSKDLASEAEILRAQLTALGYSTLPRTRGPWLLAADPAAPALRAFFASLPPGVVAPKTWREVIVLVDRAMRRAHEPTVSFSATPGTNATLRLAPR